MISKITSLALLIFCFVTAPSPNSTSEPIESYGNATVTTVHGLDEHVRLYCDIADFPPLIGRNIPVRIKGLKPASHPKDNLKLLVFLNNLFLSKDSKPEKIILKDIQRGEQFCLVADIEVDRKDLCNLLVEKKLAQKIIEVPQNASSTSANASPQNSAQSGASAADTQYIASKSSKVYHRSTCPHVARMDPTKTVKFKTREDAEKTGRRPCKTCKP